MKLTLGRLDPYRLATTHAWLARGERRTIVGPARFFLVLTPLGLRNPEVARTFLTAGLRPGAVRELPRFARSSMALYARHTSVARTAVGLAFEEAWNQVAEGASGEVWVLSRADYLLARRLKSELRQRWQPTWVEAVASERGRWRYAPMRLQPFHLPDPGQVAREWRWIDALARPA